MSTNFLKYQRIIEQLRGEVNENNFENQFNALTKHLAKTEKFILKMEVKRLATPCTRLIDLRGLVDGECRVYEHEGRTHYLDDLAIKVFEENIAYYQGYTFGVYDKVTNTENNFRVIYQREKSTLSRSKIPELAKTESRSDKTQYPVLLYKSKQYIDRTEERMNFVVNLSIIIDNDESFDVVSSDISVNGCKLRIKSNKLLTIGQIIEIRFTGLEQEFEFGQHYLFTYKICNIHVLEKEQLVGIERVYSETTKKDSFKQFLYGYIQGNKHRYKINLDNTIEALQSRIFEQFILPKVSELPVFLEQVGDVLLPKYLLNSHDNHHIRQYWQDENQQTTLHFLLNEQRMKRAQNAAKLGKTLLVYCFVHESNNKRFFYSADEYQLKTDIKLMTHFLGFAASKESFAIFNLTLNDVHAEYAQSLFTLSNSITKKDRYLNLPLLQEVTQCIAKLPYFITITELINQDLAADYQTLSFESLNKTQINVFRHQTAKNVPNIDQISINYHNQRQETRFKYNTPVAISKGNTHWSGISQDFSTSGLKIRLDKNTVLKKGDIVYLTFPKLQKVTSSFDLKNLPYAIVRINKHNKMINLRIYVEKHQHIGRSFFKLLIDKNHDKLKPDEYVLLNPGLAKALRNIYAHNFNVPTLMVQTSGSRYKTELAVCNNALGAGDFFNEMKQLSARKKYHNLYPILHNVKVIDTLNNQLKNLSADAKSIFETVYISVKSIQGSVKNKIISKCESELKTTVFKKLFIKQALKSGRFYCIRLQISHTDEPNIAYLNPELTYIGTYALHRAKQLEQQIWSMIGVIQVVDMTNEAMLRYRLL